MNHTKPIAKATCKWPYFTIIYVALRFHRTFWKIVQLCHRIYKKIVFCPSKNSTQLSRLAGMKGAEFLEIGWRSS